MSNLKKLGLAAVIVTVAGFAYITNPHRNIPTDLRDAVAGSKDFDTALPVIEKDKGGIPLPASAAPAEAGAQTNPIEWVTIGGGKFTMGTDSGEAEWLC